MADRSVCRVVLEKEVFFIFLSRALTMFDDLHGGRNTNGKMCCSGVGLPTKIDLFL